jgi:hypothetical protein
MRRPSSSVSTSEKIHNLKDLAQAVTVSELARLNSELKEIPLIAST